MWSGGPVQAEKKRSIQSSKIDLRVDGISQEEIYSDKQHMDEVKKQLEKLQDESKSQITNKDLQKRKYSKKRKRSKRWEHRTSLKHDKERRQRSARSV